VSEKPSPIASLAGGQIAIQALLSVLIHLYVGGTEDHESTKRELADLTEALIDKASIPDLPAADQKAARDQAKAVVRGLIAGHHKN
jgi:hypothetical protein